MEYVMLGLLAVLAIESAVTAAAAVRWLGSAGKGDVGRNAAEEQEAGDFEKRWQEGMDAMMGYDVAAARGAAGRNEDDR